MVHQHGMIHRISDAISLEDTLSLDESFDGDDDNLFLLVDDEEDGLLAIRQHANRLGNVGNALARYCHKAGKRQKQARPGRKKEAWQ
ncbi:MAG: hypothetical protein VKJ06_07325 [Vampirovibrionales bacterium]|nr:hypothetical protein [Vampirovibrionales bacterium]